MRSTGTFNAYFVLLLLFLPSEIFGSLDESLQKLGLTQVKFQRNLNPSLRRGTDKDKVAFLLIFLVSSAVTC